MDNEDENKKETHEPKWLNPWKPAYRMEEFDPPFSYGGPDIGPYDDPRSFEFGEWGS